MLQPPPNDLPNSTGESIPPSLHTKDIGNMTEAEAKKMVMGSDNIGRLWHVLLANGSPDWGSNLSTLRNV